jgi:predicted DNA-binding ribbon-helix-helix protein
MKLDLRAPDADDLTPEVDPRLQPQFKVLTLGRERRAFRLESVFWTALTAIGQRNGRSLAREVEVTLGRQAESLNHSAYLRASVASDLFDLWSVSAARARKADWANVLAAAPAGAFAMTRSRRILDVNEALVTFLRSRDLYVTAGTDVGDELFIEMGSLAQNGLAQNGLRKEDRQPFVTCQAVFRCAGRRTACRVRLVQAGDEKSEQVLMIGFVLAD